MTAIWNHNFYRTDPIFKVWNHAERECHQFARSHGVNAYLIDAIPLDRWLSQSNPPAVTNSIVLDDIPETHRLHHTEKNFYGVYYYPYPCQIPETTTKSYNCFINRMDPIRQSWLYQLIRRNIFHQGYVSFNMDISRIPVLGHLTRQDAFEKTFQEVLKIFQPEHDFIKTSVPYKNFVCHGDLTQTILDSRFSIVVETYFDKNNVITYSEKIFRALQLPQPWLLFGPKHAVKYIKAMGFDVLEDLVNHDYYDNIETAIERQCKILDLAQDFVNKTFDQDRCIKAARHNQNTLREFSLTWKQDYQDTILVALSHD